MQKLKRWKSNDLHLDRSTNESALLGAAEGDSGFKTIENKHDDGHRDEEISKSIDPVEERKEDRVKTQASNDLQCGCCKVEIGINVLEYWKVIDPLVNHRIECLYIMDKLGTLFQKSMQHHTAFMLRING